jgi:hypothetical protein
MKGRAIMRRPSSSTLVVGGTLIVILAGRNW